MGARASSQGRAERRSWASPEAAKFDLAAGSAIGSDADASLTPNSEKRRTSPGDAVPQGLGFACRKGLKPRCLLPNQDSWSVHDAPGGYAAFGVFDGHGDTGHLISHAVKAELTKSILCEATAPADDVESRVEEVYKRANRAVCGSWSLGAWNSGTTATVVVHDVPRARLVISHVGDSGAVLLRRSCSGGDEEGEAAEDAGGLVAEQLTIDHKPELVGERARVQEAGGVVFDDGRCHRIMARRSGMALNMSRSIGDASAQEVGVIAVPDVSVRAVSPSDVAVIVASDGLWEVISPQVVAEYVQTFSPEEAQEAANGLADEARRRWLQLTGGRVTDDITVVLAWLAHTTTRPTLAREDTASTEAPPSPEPPLTPPVTSPRLGT